MKEANQDEVVLALQKKVQSKREKLINVGVSQPETNNVFRFAEEGRAINLLTINSVNTLVNYLAHIIMYKSAFDLSKAELGQDKEKFMYIGFSYDAWKHDIQLRIDKINYRKNLEELETLEKRLAALESDELRTAKELEEIARLLD